MSIPPEQIFPDSRNSAATPAHPLLKRTNAGSPTMRKACADNRYGIRVRVRVNTLEAEDWQMDTGFRLTSYSTLPACAFTIACMVKPLVVQSSSVATSRAEAVMRSPFRVSTKRLDTALFAGMCTVYTIR